MFVPSKFQGFVWFFAFAVLCGSLANGRIRGEEISFNRDIRPILSETCFHCHGPDEEGRQAELRLDVEESAKVDLGGYSAIVPGDPDESEVWIRIIETDPDLQMPPPESNLKLDSSQRELIRRWIESGGDYEGHWAFTSPVRPNVNAEGADAIDELVERQLTSREMMPANEADPRTLIRRLYFDLVGLPPSLEDVRNFERKYRLEGDTAYDNLVEDLLSSRHFGEHMA
ncbi:MAG: DUF1549 domain-containing protein, partial [Planctomycetota bacterium]